MSNTVTLRPNGTAQQGSWSVVGAASAAVALSDNTDSTYVQLTPRCRLDIDRMRVTVPAPTLPAGAQISSVGIRMRIQTVVWPAPQPQCLGWFRCHRPPNIITAIIDLILLLLFGWRCPQQPTVVWVTQQLQNQTSDPSGNPWTLASFNNFEVNIGRDDVYANPLRVSEVYVDVVYTQQSAVTVTGPTGTITNTCRPTVTWSYTQPDANPQSKYQVAVYTAAQVAAIGFVPFVSTPLQASGWIFGTDLQWTLNQDITNGNYAAYVQVAQTWPGTGDFIGPYDDQTWTQSISGAPNAVLSSAVFDATYNRVTLTVTPGSGASTYAFAVQCSRDSGITWGPVRGALLLTATGGSMTVYDWQAPLNVPSQYRVLAYGQTGSLLFAAAGYSNVLSVTPQVNVFWIKDIFDPTMNTPLPVKYQGDSVTRRRIQGTFEVLSGDLTTQKIVVNGPMYGIEGTLTLTFNTQQPADYWAAFQRADQSGHVLLMQYPSGEQHFVLFGPGAVGSDMTWTYEYQPNYREVTVSYTEVAEPPITS
ncbi:MAG: RoPhREQ1 9 [Streptosporangiaceae bacterium]|nr:RoPhREQ1 9 [Streptosporangiaceae bacterium]